MHPSLPIVKAKVWVSARKEALTKRHPEWSESQVTTVSQWKTRFLKNVPYALLASLGTLSLLKHVIWFEATLATLLSNWSEFAVQLFKIATLGLLEWMGVEVPQWLVNYLTVGVGMTGIWAKTTSDVQVIKKSSALGDPMDHMVLSSGCFGCGLWMLYTPFLSPLWPALLVIPLTTIFSASLARDWGVSQSQLASIQIKRSLSFMEPFIVAFIVWSGFALIM